jgi:hypothetical protein
VEADEQIEHGECVDFDQFARDVRRKYQTDPKRHAG